MQLKALATTDFPFMVTRFGPDGNTRISLAPKGGLRMPMRASISQKGFVMGNEIPFGTFWRAAVLADERNILMASSGTTGLERKGLVFLLPALGRLVEVFCLLLLSATIPERNPPGRLDMMNNTI